MFVPRNNYRAVLIVKAAHMLSGNRFHSIPLFTGKHHIILDEKVNSLSNLKKERGLNSFIKSDFPRMNCRHGKVRDIYDLGDSLILIASDRISAFDWILPTSIPGKGKILTCMSVFWFKYLGYPNHLVTTDPKLMGEPFSSNEDKVSGRIMMVKKTKVIPFECVARGYLAGSAWGEYQQFGTIGGVKMPKGLRLAEKLEEPLFTPSTKSDAGHDINVTFQELCNSIGSELAGQLKTITLAIYEKGNRYAQGRGIILADSKFEFGTLDGQLFLIDEVFTPDSSRFWDIGGYRIGISPPSFDKQFVRDWLEASGWDKQSTPPSLPIAVVEKTIKRYEEALRILTVL